ncbi:uncharacterized protein F5Z01DRAFT_509387 [Emericellopsis atlantica]|uniref:Uncharacterized protein n=1 Tax=Emericellopsis atlantica TaxID=2614577 RepID=A0A9P8CRR6_9HYPO|nr:uncharacterized protein F5Z01DRAFT_509387 [Emericellopsis atlantica]KAG9256410.1 hypothetical protein F5Z01DRAFT_509387 [Emericellopsis atlantica]
MSRRYYIETSSMGKQQFVKLKRSRSHHHHREHHHHRHYELDYCPDYYKVSKEEWNTLKLRERSLEEQNCALADENKALRASLAASQAETQRLEQCVIPDLQAANAALLADNDSLRRSIDNAADHASKHAGEVAKLQCKVDKLERELKESKEETCDLRSRIRNLTRQLDGSCSRRVSELLKELSYWKHETRFWKDKWEDLNRRHHEMLDTLESRTERMESYEEILRRRRIV